MNAFEFVNKVLQLTNDDFAPLIELERYFENEWLEFKGATLPQDPRLHKSAYWHVARARFAMANGAGGVVIIGIEELKAVPSGPGRLVWNDLKNIGFNGDRDAFSRFLEQTVIRPNSWESIDKQAKHEFVWTPIENGFPQVVIKYANFGGRAVVALLVDPVPKGEKPLLVTRRERVTPTKLAKGAHKVLLVRRKGDTGIVSDIDDDKTAESEFGICIVRPAIFQLTQDFKTASTQV